jgi:CDP-diacylglycerol--glycerol-3-phosphate 3-phosphatidyltransferase
LYLLPLSGPLASLRAYLMGAAVIITLVTGVDYVARAIRLRRATSGRVASPAAADLLGTRATPGTHQ